MRLLEAAAHLQGGLAEKYVAGKMVDFGLDPADRAGAYLEPFTFPSQHTKAASLLVAGDKLVFGDDFVDLNYTGSGTVEAEVVFCGYGIHRPDLGWDDYDGIDVKGKVVMAIRGAPAAMAGTFHDERYIGSKSSTAADRGAAGLILVQGDRASSGTIQARFHRAELPAVWASRAVADRILKGKDATLEALKASRDAGEPGTSFATGTTVKPASRHSLICRQVSSSAQLPSSLTRPRSSAIAMNSFGETLPSSALRQRISASKLVTVPVRRSTLGW